MRHAATPLLGDPVTVISAFTVAANGSERFLAQWQDNAAIMAGQPGFIRAWLYDSPVDHGELRLVHVAHWHSGIALDAARATPAGRAAILRLLDDPDLHVTSRPVVYQGQVHGRGGWRLMRDQSGVEAR